MDLLLLVQVLVIGLVEGLTEFLPVSSTGHIILVSDLIGFAGPPGKVFEIAIQLGAILAVCLVYRERVLGTAAGLIRRDATAWRFAINLLVAVAPALVLGALLHDIIKEVLFSPLVVSIALIVGGVAILAIERLRGPTRVASVDAMGPGLALRIGLAQCVAMIPGVSRSGATIMGALVFGLSRRAATEFSFFLAIPTMVAATAYDLWTARDQLTLDGLAVIAIGFVVAFLAAALVVRQLVGFVERHGFAPFAWYRMALGGAMLILLALR